MHPFAYATTDIGFKHLISDLERAIRILNCVVPDFVENPITSLKTRSVFSPPLREEVQKQATIDYNAVTSTGEHIVIEMQARREIMFDERALFYTCASYSGQLNSEKFASKEQYMKLNTVYSIQFVDYNTELATGFSEMDSLIERKLSPMSTDQYVKHFLLTDKESGQVIDHFQIIQIELRRADEIFDLSPSKEDKTELEWWLSLIKNAPLYNEKTASKAPKYIKSGLDNLRLARWKQEDKTEHTREVTHNDIYAADVNDKVQIAIKKAKEGEAMGFQKGEALGEAMGFQKGEALERQRNLIRNNFKSFKEAHKASSNVVISFSFSKTLLGVSRELVEEALSKARKDKIYTDFMNAITEIQQMTDNSYAALD